MPRDKRVPLSAIDKVSASRERIERVCLKAFDLDTVKAVCYRFAAEGCQGLSVSDDGTSAEVRFRLASTVSAAEEQALVGRFHQDLLDQDLRKTVSERTELVRQLILANAFADTALVDRGHE